MTYISTFLLAISCIWIAARFFQTGKKGWGYIFTVIGISFPAVVAGCRDLTIGTDTYAYVYDYFSYARGASNYRVYKMNVSTEAGYAFLTYVIAKLTNNIAWLLFAIEFFILLLVLLSAINLKKYSWMPFMALLFFLKYFSESLNITRQSMAMAVCLYSFSFFLKGNIKTSAGIGLCSMLFHSTGFIYLTVYPIYYAIKRIKRHFYQFECLFALGAVLAVFVLDVLIMYFISVGLVKDRFVSYTDSDMWGSNMPLSEFYYAILLFMTLIILRKYSNLKLDTYRLFHLIFLAYIVLCFSAIRSTFAVRGSTYFAYMSLLAIPMFFDSIKNVKVRTRSKYLFITALIIYWLLTVVYANLGNTFPYKSKLLDI